MELTQLTYFLKVAEHGNFTHAAADLGVSQPALSRAISKLEEELGQPVFERKPRSVSLTDAGRLFQSRVEQVFEILSDAQAEITDDGHTGRLRVGVIPTIAPFFLPPLLSSFAKHHPDAQVIITEDVTEQSLKRCAQGEVDVAILALPVSAKYLEVEPLFEEELLLMLPQGHPLSGQQQVTIEDVNAFPFVLLDEAHCLTQSIVSYCRQRSVQPLSVERTSQLATVQELVSLGHGVSMAPAMAQAIDRSPDRVYRSLAGETPKREIALVWNPYRFQTKLAESFRQHARLLGQERQS